MGDASQDVGSKLIKKSWQASKQTSTKKFYKETLKGEIHGHFNMIVLKWSY